MTIVEQLEHFHRVRRWTLAAVFLLCALAWVFGPLGFMGALVFAACLAGVVWGAFHLIGKRILELLHSQERYEEMSNLLSEANLRFEEKNTLLARKINEMSTFRRITQAMTSSMELEFIFKVILKALSQDLGYDRAAICLVNEERTALEGQVSSGWEEQDIRSLAIPLQWAAPGEDKRNLDPFSRSLSEARPLLVPDLERWKDCPPALKKFFGKPHVMAVIPLVAKDNAVGALLVDNLLSGRPLDEADLRSLLTFSHQAGIAVENARLFSMEKHFNEELTRQIEIAKAKLLQAQSQLIQSERLAALGEMAAVVAHEVKNPMTSIRASTQMIGQTLKEDDSSKRYVKFVMQEIDRLDRIVHSILTFSKPPKPRFMEGDVNKLLQRILNFMEKEIAQAGVKLEVDLDPKLPTIRMDPEQMEQVLLNIIQNGLFFASRAKEKHMKISSGAKASKEVIVSIEDSGGGIPDENLKKIFEPFFTTKTQGTGLGLTISQRIVEAHGGKIKVTNHPGQGAVFSIHLPLHVPAARAV